MLRRLVVLMFLPILLLGLTAVPAGAVGDRCESGAGAKRCARMEARETGGDYFFGQVAIDRTRARVKVRVRYALLQRRTDQGWTTVTRQPGDDAFVDGMGTGTSLPCAGTPAGVYRSRGKVQWKQRGDDTVRSDVVTSRGVRKSRLC